MGGCCSSSRRCLCFPEEVCGMDIDDLFAYTTAKSVRIRDMRLGILNYGFMFAIFAYIVVYQLIYNWGYLTFIEPRMSVRLTLQQPTQGQCNPNKPGCNDSFIPLSDLSYCCDPNSSCKHNDDGSCSCDFRPEFKNYNCTYLDGADVAFAKESSIFVTTFTHAYRQTLNPDCFNGYPSGANGCSKVWLLGNDTSVFVADIEDYTLLLDHSVTMSLAGEADASDTAFTSRQMQGRLAVTGEGPTQDALCARSPGATVAASSWEGFLHDTHEKATKAPCLIPPGKTVDDSGPDVFKIDDLLQAMAVQLDNRSFEGSPHSRRYEGLVVKIAVQYHNVQLWRLTTLQTPYYFYNVSVINGSTYKEVDVVSTNYPTERTKLDRHGVLFQVTAAGQLAHFSATQLLIQLTTSLTLLAMATLAVNIFAKYVLKYRDYYNQALYDTTADFSDLMRVDRMPDEQIEQELSARRLVPRPGPRQARVVQLLEAGYQPRPSAEAVVEPTEAMESRLTA